MGGIRGSILSEEIQSFLKSYGGYLSIQSQSIACGLTWHGQALKKQKTNLWLNRPNQDFFLTSVLSQTRFSIIIVRVHINLFNMLTMPLTSDDKKLNNNLKLINTNPRVKYHIHRMIKLERGKYRAPWEKQNKSRSLDYRQPGISTLDIRFFEGMP